MVMETCCELYDVKHSRCWSNPLRSWLPDVKKRKSVKGYRESSHHESCGSLWTKRRCLSNANRDLKRSLVHILPPCQAIRFEDKSERSALLLPCAYLMEFCHSFGFGTIAVSGDSGDSVDFLFVASLQTSVIRFAHAPFTVPYCPAHACAVYYISRAQYKPH